MDKPDSEMQTGKVLATIADLVLFSVFYGFEIVLGGRRSLTLSGTEQASEGALEALEVLKSSQVTRAIKYLENQGLVRLGKESSPEITELGRQRLLAKMPTYQEKRPWDGNLYMVTYDIPVTRNRDRNTLRTFLQKIGCGKLQDSVWITPYNPAKLINDLIRERALEGMILVSRIGKDSTVGGYTHEEIVKRVYPQDRLIQEYEAFISEYSSIGKVIEIKRENGIIRFLNILQDDPQLPFELLPSPWVGTKAYGIFKKLCNQSDK